jgi:hypothetical protein
MTRNPGSSNPIDQSTAGAVLAVLASFGLLVAAVVAGALIASGVTLAICNLVCPLDWRLRIWGTVAVVATGVAYHTATWYRRQASKWLTFLVALLAAVLWATTLPSLFGTYHLVRETQTKTDMRQIVEMMEQLRMAHGSYPTLDGVAALNDQVVGSLPEIDKWGNEFLLISEPHRYVLVSYGECGNPDVSNPWMYDQRPSGSTLDWSRDSVVRNGLFVD